MSLDPLNNKHNNIKFTEEIISDLPDHPNSTVSVESTHHPAQKLSGNDTLVNVLNFLDHLE